MDRAADGLAAHFAERGVGPGAVVALVLPSSIDYAICYQAAMRLRAITTGINPRLGPTETASIVERTEPRVIVRAEDLDTFRAHYTATRRRCRWHEADDPVAICWTSGTTGPPKGAVFDHDNLRAVAIGAGAIGERFDRRLSPLPFAHVAYMSRPWEEIEKVITVVIPTMPWKAADALAVMESRTRHGWPGRSDAVAAVARPAAVRARRPLGVADRGYGRHDRCPRSCARDGDSARVSGRDRIHEHRGGDHDGHGAGRHPGRHGAHGGPGAQQRRAPSGQRGGRAVSRGEVGRVRCRSGAVMRGYWHDDARTAEVLDADGWLTIGDMGVLDERGYLTLVGRKSEMYIRGGYNVYPAEVERVLEGRPEVAQVAVVGTPDRVLGEIGTAFVVAAAGQQPELDALRAHVRSALADYKAPDRLVVLTELPVTAMGKVDKRALLGLV